MMRHNQSAFERNRTYLNVEGSQFLDISYITGADDDGDSRAVVAADFRNDGRLDLLVRQVGGAPLLYYQNDFPVANYLKVSLRGRKSNRLGIGARVSIVHGEGRQYREVYPANTFNSQAAAFVHFGLKDVDTVEKIEIEWPSGTKQTLRDVPANQHVYITENQPTLLTAVPGKTVEP